MQSHSKPEDLIRGLFTYQSVQNSKILQAQSMLLSNDAQNIILGSFTMVGIASYRLSLPPQNCHFCRFNSSKVSMVIAHGPLTMSSQCVSRKTS